MIELLYDTIRMTTTDNNSIEVIITDALGEQIIEGEARFIIPKLNLEIVGQYDETAEVWVFIIPANQPIGRYEYTITLDGEVMAFPAPIYFVRG